MQIFIMNSTIRTNLDGDKVVAMLAVELGKQNSHNLTFCK